VAILRFATTAEEREPVILRAVQQPFDGLHELRLLGHRSIQRMTFRVVVFFALWAATERPAEEEIPDASVRHCGI
jgi:hypothetical protein